MAYVLKKRYQRKKNYLSFYNALFENRTCDMSDFEVNSNNAFHNQDLTELPLPSGRLYIV
jgi:hypothetical protein